MLFKGKGVKSKKKICQPVHKNLIMDVGPVLAADSSPLKQTPMCSSVKHLTVSDARYSGKSSDQP